MGDRLNEMVTLVEQQGFLSVKALSRKFAVSEVTIRRDLQRLHDTHRLLRTYGGAAPLMVQPTAETTSADAPLMTSTLANFSMEQVDVLVNVSLNPRADLVLLERAEKHGVKIIAESLGMQGAKTLVAVDNFQAGRSLGHWAGEYAQQHFQGQARVLDLTYHLRNTQDRSRGFVTGLQETLSTAQVVLSLTTQSDWQSAYQLTADALHVHPDINVIFCINDIVACGAIQACRDLGVDPAAVLVLTFGLEGKTLKAELLRREHLKAGLAMFPEIVGPLCVEAAIDAFNGVEMPAQIITPHAVLTAESLPQIYTQQNDDWLLSLEQAATYLQAPVGFQSAAHHALPNRIGFLVPFSEHEWYQSLTAAMQSYAWRLGIVLAVADAAENLRDELVLRKLGIAHEASKLVKPGDVILIDGGQVTTYLAEALRDASGIMVITNAMAIFDVLRNRPHINLILTGGILRHESQTLIGPTVETVFRELRADKLFMAVSGVSLDFGLSHTNLAEVAVKQAMIRAAREVILLADHTKFEQESVMQIAPLDVVDKLITDHALPASTRLELAKRGIEVLLAKN
ncbi:MAG: substrate-binding domain-containing protein [Caldilineaceae bacterium]|jgi:DeoR/GlpR family transcriptional regulator of sugar metabolism|nr:substrate-binding domain-containing protein [Caldilineaceae bacterium]